MRVLMVAAVLLSLPAPAADQLGPESCKGCHPEAYTAWKASKHARSRESLSPQQQKDSRCLSCHSPEETEGAVQNVTCESCHGPGQYYSPSYVMKDPELARLVGLVDPSEKACRTCHDASSPSLRPFEFVAKLKLIDHWTAERERRAKQAAADLETPKPTPKKQK